MLIRLSGSVCCSNVFVMITCMCMTESRVDRAEWFGFDGKAMTMNIHREKGEALIASDNSMIRNSCSIIYDGRTERAR